jgi:hypothetical protein
MAAMHPCALQHDDAETIFLLRETHSNFGFTAMNILTRALRSAFDRPRRDPALEYLNESVSLLDLERRQQEIDAGAFRKRRFGY